MITHKVVKNGDYYGNNYLNIISLINFSIKGIQNVLQTSTMWPVVFVVLIVQVVRLILVFLARNKAMEELKELLCPADKMNKKMQLYAILLVVVIIMELVLYVGEIVQLANMNVELFVRTYLINVEKKLNQSSKMYLD